VRVSPRRPRAFLLLLLAGAVTASACSSADATVRARVVVRHGTAPCGPDVPLPTAFPGYAKTVAAGTAPDGTPLEVAAGDRITCRRDPARLIADVRYSTVTLPDGGSLQLRMDVLVPDRATHPAPVPAVIFAPGGGFSLAPKESSIDKRLYVAEAGFVVASIEYRTIDQGRFPDPVHDIKTAVRFLRDHAARFRIAPDRIGVWGESAGGYLAAFAGTTGDSGRFDPGRGASTEVQAVVDMFGLSDLGLVSVDFDAADRFRHLQPTYPEAQFVFGKHSGRSIADDPDAVQAANPATYADATAPPFLLFHGERDTLVSPGQTQLMADALRAAGTPVTQYTVVGAGHGGAEWSSTAVMDRIVRFLDRTLNR
jgi:acetyl esterase/lipase